MTRAEKAAVAIGRAALAEWLAQAKAHGTIYYTVPHVGRTGMSRRITLHTIGTDHDGKPTLVTLGPWWRGANRDEPAAVARDWGFSYKHRAFVVGGTGMDMVFHLVYTLAGISGCDPDYANHVRREAIS